jgi:hypothetical protein
MKFTIELDIGLTYLLQSAPTLASDENSSWWAAKRSYGHCRRRSGLQPEPETAARGNALMASATVPAMLRISHHERVEGHPHRWHVFLHGRDQPIPVELDPEDRRGLELTDEEIHDRLPTALERHHTENRDDLLMVPGEQYDEASWDAPVRLLQNHFV